MRKQSSATTIALLSQKISSKTRARVTVKVTVDGVADPTGTVRLYDGAKQIAIASVKAGGAGEVVVQLPRLRKGRHTITATYVGTDSIDTSTSRPKKLAVVGAKKKR